MPKYIVEDPDLSNYPAWWICASSIEEAHHKAKSCAASATARKNKSNIPEVKAVYGKFARVLSGYFRMKEVQEWPMVL